MTFEDRVQALIDKIQLEPSYSILLVQDKLNSPGRYFIQLEKVGIDAITGAAWEGRG